MARFLREKKKLQLHLMRATDGVTHVRLFGVFRKHIQLRIVW